MGEMRGSSKDLTHIRKSRQAEIFAAAMKANTRSRFALVDFSTDVTPTMTNSY